MRLGVIVGRFQVPELTDAHIRLIDHVAERADLILILIGVSRARGTKRNPLDYYSRYMMVNSAVKARHWDERVTIVPIVDERNDQVWSNKLDAIIRNYGASSVTLYGGRDSFLEHYTGKNDRLVLAPDVLGTVEEVSGTKIREQIEKPSDNWAFRAGVIYGVNTSYRSVYQCVDIAVLQPNSYYGGVPKILLGRKENEDRWRLPGGFVDATDHSLENAAIRELWEETHLLAMTSDLHYIGSGLSNDWRYPGPERIMSALYVVDYKPSMGNAKAGDDLHQLELFNLADQISHLVVPEHLLFLEKILKHVDKK